MDGRYIVTTDNSKESVDILRWSIKYGQDHVSIVPEEYYKPNKLTPECKLSVFNVVIVRKRTVGLVL